MVALTCLLLRHLFEVVLNQIVGPMPVFGCEPPVEMCGVSLGGIALGDTRRDVYAVPT